MGLKSARCLEACRDFGNADRPPKAVALHGMHTAARRKSCWSARFDAFGGDLHSEATTKADDRVHNGGGIRSLLD